MYEACHIERHGEREEGKEGGWEEGWEEGREEGWVGGRVQLTHKAGGGVGYGGKGG